MANKVIKHCYDSCAPASDFKPSEPVEPDKSKSISELNQKELYEMLSRLRNEIDVQRIIRDLKLNSGERDTFDKPFEIDTKTPINQLYHWGIPGMKWGKRRFQNPDGTRTTAGKARDRRHGKSEEHMKSRKAKKRGAEGLSNDELKKVNERIKLESEYKKLTAEQMVKSENWVKDAISTAGKQALTDFSKGIFLGGAKLLVKEISPQFAEAAFKIKDKNPS